MRLSISTILFIFAAAVAAVKPQTECAVCQKKIVESDKSVYKLVGPGIPQENTTLCGYQEKQGKEVVNEGFCSYNHKGNLIENGPNDLNNCPECVEMEKCHQ
ncbi:hypothetical protein DFH09DRAFT_191178 [Mycena vulgaris]|nr:hypothetical protein DFH09DRAFT_191178 [Mycena vulgaris]